MSEAMITTPKNLINEYLMMKRYKDNEACIIIEQQTEPQTITKKVKNPKDGKMVDSTVEEDVFYAYIVVPSASNEADYDDNGMPIKQEQKLYVGINKSSTKQSQIKAYTNHSTPVSELHQALSQQDPNAGLNIMMKIKKPYQVSKRSSDNKATTAKANSGKTTTKATTAKA